VTACLSGNWRDASVRRARTRTARRLATATLAWAVAETALAGNGLNQIGFGTESAMMAGADVAMARDTTFCAPCAQRV
jgi:hypothetical protein